MQTENVTPAARQRTPCPLFITHLPQQPTCTKNVNHPIAHSVYSVHFHFSHHICTSSTDAGTYVLRYVRCVDVRWARIPPTVRLERVSVTELVMRHLVTTLTGKPSGAELRCVCYLLSLPGSFTVSHAKKSFSHKGLSRALCSPSCSNKESLKGCPRNTTQLFWVVLPKWHSWFIIPQEAVTVNMPQLVQADDWHWEHCEV